MLLYADFNQDGQLDMFVATLTYWPPTTQEAATGFNFEFYIKILMEILKKIMDIFHQEILVYIQTKISSDYNNDNLPEMFLLYVMDGIKILIPVKKIKFY